MSDVKLGQTPDRNAQRDAIHVAVVPVIAGVRLTPGQRVEIIDDKACPAKGTPIGIVDPFRDTAVNAGGRFWLCLIPNTVTGMRHHWSHPLFQDEQSSLSFSKADSEAWLRKFASQSDVPSFDILIAAATGEHVHDDDYGCAYSIDGEYLTFLGSDASGDIPYEFWIHVENYTGKKCQLRPKYFSCSC